MKKQSPSTADRKQPQELIKASIFLFINSGSGSGLGQQLSSLQSPMKFNIQQGLIHLKRQQKIVEVFFYNLRVNKQQGFNKLNQFIKQGKKCYGVICGGDGTVTWIIGQMSFYKVPKDLVSWAIIPLGTGNDFSQSLGWGPTTNDLLLDNFRKLKKLFSRMLTSKTQDMDIWEVQAQSYHYGKIQKVQNGQDKNLGHKITKSFINYFSFGLDAKVGYSFDRHRTDSRLGNLAVYGALGFVKGVTKTKNLSQLLQDFCQQRQIMKNGHLVLTNATDHKVIFSPQQNDSSQKHLYETNENILALNINSFMGGAKDIWKNSTVAKKQKAPIQDPSDSKLQFVSFSGSLSIGMEKTFGGFAHRVTQGEGPFVFNFKKYDANQKHRTYLQIDGEFLRFNHPKVVRIKKSSLLDGKFKVLRYTPQKSLNTGCGCFG